MVDHTRLVDGDLLAAGGWLAARYIEEQLKPRDVLGISWGTGVQAAAQAMGWSTELQVDVVQMIGSVGTNNPEIDGPALARTLAEKLGGRYYYLHAPVLVENPVARDLLLAEATIQDTLNRARGAAVALVGIGGTEPGASGLVRAGHLTELQMSGLRARGAVGETCAIYFDIQGDVQAGSQVNRRAIGLEVEALKRIPTVVAVACGLPKARAILANPHGGYVNVLATDDTTAQALLDQADTSAASSLADDQHPSSTVRRRSSKSGEDVVRRSRSPCQKPSETGPHAG